MEKEKVNHPTHYNRDNAMECIDEMILLFGVKETMSFCKLNTWKYRYRAAEKNGIEDLKKSDWYLAKYKELKEKKLKKSNAVLIQLACQMIIILKLLHLLSKNR